MKRLFFTTTAILLASVPAFAQSGGSDYGMYAIGAGIALGLAVIGGGLGQGKIGAAAMDGIARNPQASGSLFVPMIIALVFVETLILFTWVVANGIAGKIPGIE